MLRVFVVFITLFVCIFTIEAKASNIGYIWFSRSGYYDRTINNSDAVANHIMAFEKLPSVNSIIEVPNGNIFYTGFDIVEKINNHYQKAVHTDCDGSDLNGFIYYGYVVGNDKKCSIKGVELQKDKDFFLFHGSKIIRNGIFYYKAKVLGYVMFSNELNFVLVESI